MTKSPRAVAQEALRLAREVLPAYSSKFSRKDFTQHQLFAALALKTFFKTDYRGVVRLLADFAELREDSRPGRGAPLLDPLLCRQAAAKKGAFVVLLFRATVRAQEGGLIGAKPTAAIDATGMESRHTSRYFFKRAGRKHNSRLWTKLAVACDTASHFFTAATVSLGPANDAPQFRPLMAQASLAVGYDRVLGDAAFDGEESHRYCREDLGVRSTVIPINRRNGGGSGPRLATGGRWSSGSARSRGAAGTSASTGSAGRRRAPSPDTSGCSARRCGASRMRRANTSATCGYSPTTSCSSPLQVRGFQQSTLESVDLIVGAQGHQQDGVLPFVLSVLKHDA